MKFVEGRKISKAEQKESLRLFIFTTLGILFIGGLLLFFPVNKYRFYPPCPWYFLTKTYCPGCGSLRGLNGMIHGNLLSMFKHNILAGFSLPFLLYSYISIAIKGMKGYQLPNLGFTKAEIYFLLILLIIYAILRNFFTILAP